jgi:hypothetical protein
MIPIILDFVTILSVVAGGFLLWLNLRAWRRSMVVIINHDRSEDHRGAAPELPRKGEGIISWVTVFDDPIDLPDGQKLITLRDAATYIASLPAAEQTANEWQAAARCLIDAAKGHDYSLTETRTGILRALNRRDMITPSNPE